jgi:broad specificity phosphatase PhoE
MIKFVLIRPGATDYNAQGRIQGTLDVPLSTAGNAEVDAALAELTQLQLKAIYFAPCQSAEETAKKIAQATNLKPKQIDALANLNHGLWQGMLVDEVKRKHPRIYRQWQEHPESICPPEGETIDNARDRFQPAIQKLVKRHKSGAIGLVVPEPLATLIAEFLERSQVGDLWKANANTCSWDAIEWEPLAATAKE